MDRRTFVFNLEWWDIIRDFPAEVRLEVYDSIMEYASSGTFSELKQRADTAMRFITREMDRNAQKYQEVTERRKAISEKRREAGRKGAEASNRKAAKNGKIQQKSANADIYDNDNDCVYDSDNDSVSDNDNDSLRLSEIARDAREEALSEFVKGHAITLEGFCKNEGMSLEEFLHLSDAVMTEWRLRGWKGGAPGAESNGEFTVSHLLNQIRVKRKAENGQRSDFKARGGAAGRSRQGAPELGDIAGAILRRTQG